MMPVLKFLNHLEDAAATMAKAQKFGKKISTMINEASLDYEQSVRRPLRVPPAKPAEASAEAVPPHPDAGPEEPRDEWDEVLDVAGRVIRRFSRARGNDPQNGQ